MTAKAASKRAVKRSASSKGSVKKSGSTGRKAGSAVSPATRRKPARASAHPDGPPRTFTVFLDRDGVLNKHRTGQVIRFWRQFRFLPGVPAAFARLNRPGIQTCLITNQQWFRLGFGSESTLGRLHARMRLELEMEGGRLDHVEAATGWPFLRDRRRKPKPGMLQDGAATFLAAGSPVDKSRAVMIGDKPKDAQAAAAFGIPCILVATSHSPDSLARATQAAGIVALAIVADFPAAVDRVVALVATTASAK